MTIRRGAGLLLALMVALALPACSRKPPPPTVAELTVTAAPGLNPAPPHSRPSPVVVRIYDLARADDFLNADFYQLHDNAAAVLGEDLIARDQVSMLPGTRRTLVRQVDPKTRFIGLIADFRSIDQADWRALAPVPLNRTTPYEVTLGPLAIALAPAATGS